VLYSAVEYTKYVHFILFLCHFWLDPRQFPMERRHAVMAQIDNGDGAKILLKEATATH
jgi:hypothetical protein